MRKNPEHQQMRRYLAALDEAGRTGRDADELFEEREAARTLEAQRSIEASAALEPDRERLLDAMNGGLSRRELLKRGLVFGAAMAGAGALLGGPMVRRARAAGPRVVIVGGGLAGLTAAYRINRAKGWVPDVYEAEDHVGGRTHTLYGLTGGQHAEGGGGEIDSRQFPIQSLAQELGLWPLLDTWINYYGADINYFNGHRIPKPKMNKMVNENWAEARRAWGEIGRHIPTYQNFNKAARHYDQMSVQEFINTECPHGMNTLAGEWLKIYMEAYYAGRVGQLSSIHFILERGGIWGGGGWDERWAIPGGNQMVATTLEGLLPGGSVHFDMPLIALVKNGDGTYTLTFDDAGTPTDVVADRVILAIPPGPLSEVDLSQAGFSAVKMRSINKQKLGSNAKLNFQFTSSVWLDTYSESGAMSDESFGWAWQSCFQGTAPAIMIMENNPNSGTHPPHGQASDAVRDQILAGLEGMWPGVTAAFIPGQAWLDYWPNDEWAQGSYSYYGLGGFTSYGGIQPKRQGKVHFAAEHTAPYIESGYMNGGVLTGDRAANEVTSY